MSKYKHMTDDYLRKNYVPDVYQHDIFQIDYQKLKDVGIKLISFDIDDTIADLLVTAPSKDVITLFENLKNMGFELMLMTNAWDSRAKKFADGLGIGDQYTARAEKPLTGQFKKAQKLFGVEKSQMAHVGNSMLDDVAGGNAAGIITCLVRRAGITGGLPKRIPGVRTSGQKLRKVLKKRGIWRKHHKYVKGDQYYQLGGTPGYILQEQGEAYQAAMIASEQQYIKNLRDSIK